MPALINVSADPARAMLPKPATTASIKEEDEWDENVEDVQEVDLDCVWPRIKVEECGGLRTNLPLFAPPELAPASNHWILVCLHLQVLFNISAVCRIS